MITFRAIEARFLCRDIEDAKVRCMARALHAVPDMPHEVFCLYRFENLDRRQIAERLGISEQQVTRHFTVAMRAIHRARIRQDENARRWRQRYRRYRRAIRALRKALKSVWERLES